MSEIDSVFEVAKLGIEADSFVSSSVGQYLVGRAEQEANLALEKMKTADPTDAKVIREIQNELNLPDRVVKWLTDVIAEGHACEFQLRAMEES